MTGLTGSYVIYFHPRLCHSRCPMEWSSLPPPVSWVAVDCQSGWKHQSPATNAEKALLRGAAWLPLVEIGPLRRDTRSLSRQLKSVSWQRLLDLHFAHTSYPGVSIFWYLAPATSFFSNDLSEGWILSCLLDCWVSLGHFPCAREPAVLRIACQYILALHSVAVSLSQPPLCPSCRSPPILCC